MAVIAAVLGSFHGVLADERVEPIAFEEVIPSEPGELAVRASVVAEREAMSSDTRFVSHGQLYFGIFDRLGGELDVPYIVRTGDDEVSGLGNLGASLKYSLHAQSGSTPHVSAMVEIATPTASTSVMAEPTTEVEAGLGVAFVRPAFAVQATLGGAASFATTTEYAVVWNASVAASLPVGLYGFAEILTETELGDLTVHALGGPGLKLRVSDEMFVAASGLVGIDAETPSRVIAQVQYGF